MEGYLRSFSLRRVLEEGSFDVMDVYHIDLIRNIRSLKADIRNNNNRIASFTQLNTLIGFNINKDLKIKIILEDDFIPNMFDSIVDTGVIRMEDYSYISSIIYFIKHGTNGNLRFLVKLVSCKRLLTVVTNIIKSNCLNDTEKSDLAFIIWNITFQYDQRIFRDQVIKTFLLDQSVDPNGYFSVSAVMRIFPAEELRSSVDVICSVIPKIVRDLERLCPHSPLKMYFDIIKSLCQLPESKKLLAENFKLYFLLRRMLGDTDFRLSVLILRELMAHLYTEEQLRQIEEDVEYESR